MSKLFDEAERSLNSLANRQRYDEKNRLALLSIHGWIGAIVGALIIFSGPPSVWLDFFSRDSAWVLASPALFGGVILLWGLYGGRVILVEAIGMSLILVWDLSMTALFVSQGLLGEASTLYPIMVYLGFALLMSIHIKTLIQFLRQG